MERVFFNFVAWAYTQLGVVALRWAKRPLPAQYAYRFVCDSDFVNLNGLILVMACGLGIALGEA